MQHNWKDALKTSFALFSNRILTKEIVSYLLEIIENENIEVKNIISVRLEYFFGELLLNDFLFEYNPDNRLSPIDSSLNTFYGYWIILSNLGSKKNFLNDKIREKFSFLLACLSRVGFFNINLSYQNLTGIDLSLTKFESLDLEYANFAHGNLSMAKIQYFKLDHCILTRANLDRTRITRSYFYVISERPFTSNINYLRLNYQRFINVDMSNLKIENVQFNFSTFQFTNFSSSNLKGSSFAESSIEDVNFTKAILDDVTLPN